METITLSIPNMKSPHCMMVVSGTVKNLKGAALKKVSPGEAEIELTDTTRVSVMEAIERVGYTVANK